MISSFSIITFSSCTLQLTTVSRYITTPSKCGAAEYWNHTPQSVYILNATTPVNYQLQMKWREVTFNCRCRVCRIRKRLRLVVSRAHSKMVFEWKSELCRLFLPMNLRNEITKKSQFFVQIVYRQVIKSEHDATPLT